METTIDTVTAEQLEKDDITDLGIVTTVFPLENGNVGVYFGEDEEWIEFHPDTLFDLWGMVYTEEV
jgi:hypothetical protein